ncbi:hypothetical protein [Agromyces laixinhei]|uniref:hypothetical protein n=1 Tax=Agromyces laixinhei TaxID=2585717 RepID=UPI001F2DF0D5|nr:hypothetical protein [Agromyces laixinhei]
MSGMHLHVRVMRGMHLHGRVLRRFYLRWRVLCRFYLRWKSLPGLLLPCALVGSVARRDRGLVGNRRAGNRHTVGMQGRGGIDGRPADDLTNQVLEQWVGGHLLVLRRLAVHLSVGVESCGRCRIPIDCPAGIVPERVSGNTRVSDRLRCWVLLRRVGSG